MVSKGSDKSEISCKALLSLAWAGHSRALVFLAVWPPSAARLQPSVFRLL